MGAEQSYNLLEENWIPVLYNNGKVERVGIKKALMDAGKIRQIAASNPMDRVAIIRFLLAVLYWCKGNPPSDEELTKIKSFPADGFTKLDENKDCFNLLGKEKRFYQQKTSKKEWAITSLLQEIPSGNNFWHLRHSTDKINGLCFACCAMGLLRLPIFSVTSLPDLKTGINGTPPIYVIPWGRSLLNTLQANWVQYGQLGVPAWVQADIRPTMDEDVQILTGLTLLSRRVWLHDPIEKSGVCISCGVRETSLILSCEYQSSGELKNDHWNDPHVVYSNDTPRKSSRASDLSAAKKFRMDRPWPYLLSNMLEAGKIGPGIRPISLFVVGFATDKAKNIDVWERIIAVPSSEISLDTAKSMILQWQQEGNLLDKRIPRPDTGTTAIIASIRPEVEGKVSGKVDELLAKGESVWVEAAREYRPMMAALAHSLSPGFTSESVQRRNHIGNLLPDMRRKIEPQKKTGRKKGGEK